MTEPVPKFRNERGTKESKVAREACKNSWKDDGLEESREEKESGADRGDPAYRQWNGDREEKNLLVRKSGRKAKEE